MAGTGRADARSGASLASFTAFRAAAGPFSGGVVAKKAGSSGRHRVVVAGLLVTATGRVTARAELARIDPDSERAT